MPAIRLWCAYGVGFSLEGGQEGTPGSDAGDLKKML